jgi:hypothetical protein
MAEDETMRNGDGRVRTASGKVPAVAAGQQGFRTSGPGSAL